jgi:hypothetical protein
MSISRTLTALCFLCSCSTLSWAQDEAASTRGIERDSSLDTVARSGRKPLQNAFLARPYLQLGGSQAPGKLLILWHAPDVDAPWAVEFRTQADRDWKTAKAPKFNRVAVAGIEPHRVYRATIKVVEPGGAFSYRVRKGDDVLFEAAGHAPKAVDQPHRFAVFGDCGAGTPEQRLIAYRAFLSRPDFVMITGDIVYGKGLISEYREKFWPVYNADEASPSTGAPLLRSTLFLAAPGNHDIASRDLGKTPDGLAYFYYWFQPHNGPVGDEGGPLVAPLVGPEASRRAFREAAGNSFPRMANFSFDYGNAHWTVLDANATVDWTDPDLREWVAKDLAAARNATWRFVSFHQPGFSSSRKHFDEQHMRILAPVFESGKVDLVFSGHVHNYQRTYPLRFEPAAENDASAAHGADGRPVKARHVDGKLTLDRKFDGHADTTPEGVIYVVSGAGGQKLYNPEQQDDTASWQPFTCKHISKVHSLTIADVDDKILTIRQLTSDGEEIDRFIMTK